MDQVIEFAELLHSTPALLPWVCFVTFIAILIAQHKRILSYFDARIDAYREKRENDAIIAELIRNNTAALNNNTAVLELTKNDRGASRDLIKQHEASSIERINEVRGDIAHLQTVVNRIDQIVSSNSENIRLIEDRTSK